MEAESALKQQQQLIVYSLTDVMSGESWFMPHVVTVRA